VTGQPEFFFKKIIKQIRKALPGKSEEWLGPAVGLLTGSPLWGGIAGGIGGGLGGAIAGGGAGYFSPGMQNIMGIPMGGKARTFMELLRGRAAIPGGVAIPGDPRHTTAGRPGLTGLFGRGSFDLSEGSIGEKFGFGRDKGILTAGEKAEIGSILAKTEGQLTMGEKLLYDKYTNSLKTDFLGGASIQDLAFKYGLTVAVVGKVLEETTSDEDVGTRLPKYVEHGKDYGWGSPHIDYDYPIPIVPGQAEGGIMDLQGGGFSRGPGTGTSDSIPAMLSDGEFVMTADAVRGAGGGDRREGARKMYETMDRLEARV
jgi:hypothetical protein